MKKTFLLVCAALTMALSVHAIRADHRLFPVKQSDGTTVMLYKNGDGHLAFYTTEDHQVVVRNADGTLCYGELRNGELVATTMVCHNVEERTADEVAFVANNTLKPTDAALTQLMAPLPVLGKERRATLTSNGLGEYGSSADGEMPSIGAHTVPVILVEFSDRKFQSTTTVEKMNRYFNEEGYNEDNVLQCGSVKDYFVAQSRGMFVPTFDVVAKVTLDNTVAYYGQNVNGGDYGDYIISMVREAVSKAVAQGVDFSVYKNEKGAVPNLTIMYAGYGEATGGDEDTIWPHELDLAGYSSLYNTFSGVKFNSYFVGNELYGNDKGSYFMGMGVFVHEFSHAMGLPDFYDPKYSYKNDEPFGNWSVMDAGSYVNSTYAPMGYNAYERSFMGWLNIPELSEAEAVSLTDPNLTEGDFAVMLRRPNASNEYFILENRQPGTWYPSEYGSGLMVTRFAYNATAWSRNTVNPSADAKRAMLVTANGRKLGQQSAQESDLFGNGTNNNATFTWYGGTAVTDSPIFKVIKQPDGTLTFNYKDKSLIGTAVSNGDLYEKVTDASTLAVNDTVIFVNEAEAVAMGLQQQSGSRSVVSVNVTGGQAYGNDGVLKFTVLKTNTGAFGFYSPAKKAYLSAASSGIKLATKADNNCMASVSIADGNASVVFQGNFNRKNVGYSSDDTQFSCFADEQANVQLYRKVSGSTNGISGVKTYDANRNARVYNLNGQYVGTSLTGLPKGIYVQDGRKYVVK